MLFSDNSRCLYTKSPLVEAACQLTFPADPTILTKSPDNFHDVIRREFPRFLPAWDAEHPKLSFLSADGLWKLALGQDSIALSTLRYHRWEDFIFRMDKPLVGFFQCYCPSCFEGVGLRYVNAVSRRNLGLSELLWDDLIQPPYLGVLGEPDVEETMIQRSSLNTEMTLPDGCRIKMRAGPGPLSTGKQDPEIKFILDFDLSVSGTFSPGDIPPMVSNLHDRADDLFQGAVTKLLSESMGSAPMW